MLRKTSTNTLLVDRQLAAVCAHFGEHGAALCNAAELIGGEAGTARVLRLVSDLRGATRLDRSARRRLVDLHRFLSLDPVVEGPEPDLSAWVLLDPDSLEVEQICLLADRLYDLLIEIGALDEQKQALALQAQGAA
jgi:hypothetical protein